MPQKGLGAERSGVASLEDAQVPKTRVVELRVPQKGPEAERSGVASLEDAQVPKTRVAELTKSPGTGQGCPTSGSVTNRTRGRAVCPLSSGTRINRDAELTRRIGPSGPGVEYPRKDSGPNGPGASQRSRVAELTNRRAPVRGARRRVCQKGLGAERSVRYPQGDFYNHLRSVLKGFGLEQKTAPLRRRCSSAATAATQHSHAFGCSQQTTYSHAFGCSPLFSCSCIRSCLSQNQTSQ